MPEKPAAALEKGTAALSAHLWGVAADHFRTALAAVEIPADRKPAIALRLVESLIRAGKFADAAKVLSQPLLRAEPAVPYWRALVLAGEKQPAAAAEILTGYVADAGAPHHPEAVFTLAALRLALGQPDSALGALDYISPVPPTRLSASAALHRAEILLDLDRAREAAAAMPETAALAPADQPTAQYLRARLLLLEDRPQEAAEMFRPLAENPARQSTLIHHLARIGLADAMDAQGYREEAVSDVVALVSENPESPALPEAFKRILTWLPEEPKPDDPLLAKLAAWTPSADAPAAGLINLSDGAIGAWPRAGKTEAPAAQDPAPYAIYVRGVGLLRNPATAAEGLRLLNRLRVSHPSHVLAARGLYQTAVHSLANGRAGLALPILESLRNSSDSKTVKGEAAFLEARTAYEEGNPKLAAKLYAAAAENLEEPSRTAAAVNSAISLIRSGENKNATLPAVQAGLAGKAEAAADLGYERALSLADPAARRDALLGFIKDHPTHRKNPAARIAAAAVSLDLPVPDAAGAKNQLDALAADPQKLRAVSPSFVIWLRIRIADLANDSRTVVALARPLLAGNPPPPEAPDAAYVLGRHLFLTREYNEARLVVEKLAAADTDPARRQAAWLLAARSAALVPTTQSRQESLILFDKAIEAGGSAGPLARLEKARLLIDMNRTPEAAGFLRSWFDALEPTDPLYFPAGLLLAESIYAQGDATGKSLAEALGIYDKLLATAKNLPGAFVRIQYLRGRTLEQMPDPANPAKTREEEAFKAYYSVLETDTPPAEWHYFGLCGFRALALLEKAGRWQAAIACARRIASFNGPRTKEAADRAAQLQLKNMVYDD